MGQKLFLFFCLLAVMNLSSAQESALAGTGDAQLQPWSEDPRYWQYKGEPVLLVGGSETDHLFLFDGLLTHVDEIARVGGNYVRNTMSQREGQNLKPYKLQKDGTFDLDIWNHDYWSRFESMLKWTHERDIIVQIEVWDRFDYSRDFWTGSPWNPEMNRNYDPENSGFDKEYPNHPSRDKQPFFHTIPGMPLYDAELDKIRSYQEAFVEKMLSYSLNYGHVLYCMDNETSTPATWGKYWMEFIKRKAAEKQLVVFSTDMFDDAHKGQQAINTPIIFKDFEQYQFADISQVNSRNFGEDHWRELQWLIKQVHDAHPRPCNHTKIYGGGYLSFGTGGFEDGVERFWRNLLAGSASSRFHRPTAGNGLNDRAQATIKAARIVEQEVKLWDVEPHQDLLTDRAANEAYLAANPGEQYVLYFTYGGSVGLDLSDFEGTFRLQWVSVTEGILLKEDSIIGGSNVTIEAPFKGGWIALIVRDKK